MGATVKALLIVSLAIAALTPALSWAAPPDNPVPSQSSDAVIDPQAMELLQKVETTMIGLKTFHADCRTTMKFIRSANSRSIQVFYAMSSLIAEKPARMRYDKWQFRVAEDASEADRWQQVHSISDIHSECDGRELWHRSSDREIISKSQFKAERLRPGDEPWSGFYTTADSIYSKMCDDRSKGRLVEIRREDAGSVEGIRCDVVAIHTRSNGSGHAYDDWVRLFISGDNMIRRRIKDMASDNKPIVTIDETVRDIHINEQHEPNQAFVAESNVYKKNLSERHRAMEINSSKFGKTKPLLEDQSVAPDLSALDAQGNPIRLSKFRGKVVVVDFWASWSGSTVNWVVHDQDIVKKLQSLNIPVVLLAIDSDESRDAFSAWVAKHAELDSAQFLYVDSNLSNMADDRYHKSGIPTQYVIDDRGIIRASAFGFEGPNAALESTIRAVSRK